MTYLLAMRQTFKLVFLFCFFLFQGAWATEQILLQGTPQNDQSYTFDLNQDGLQDILSISVFNKTVTPLIQIKKGEFSQGITSELYEHPFSSVKSIYPGKFDKDDFLDLVVVYDSHFIAFYKGNQRGEFFFHSEYEIPFGKFLVSTSGDLNSDGQLEIIVSPFLVESNRFSLFVFSNNKETFNQFPFTVKYQMVYLSSLLTKVRTTTITPDIERINEIRVGKFNNDHMKDLILLDRENKRIITLLSNSANKFEPAEILRLPFSPYQLSLLEINNDSLDDLIASPSPGEPYIYTHTYLRTEKKFMSSQMLNIGKQIFDFKKGTFFKDYGPVYVATSVDNSELTFYQSGVNGKILQTPIKKISVSDYPGLINCSDIDGDERLDLVITGSALDNSSLTILQNLSLED